MWLVDLKTWNGKYHENVKESDLGQNILDFCKNSAKLFDCCTQVGIERLPPLVHHTTRPAMHTNRQVHAVMCYIEQTIRILFPHIKIHYVEAVSVKAFMGTGGGTSYSHSKALSASSNTLPPFYMNQAVERFRKTRHRLQVDPIEATQIAMYMNKHMERLEQKVGNEHTKKQRVFEKVELTAPVIYPPPKKPRTRSS